MPGLQSQEGNRILGLYLSKYNTQVWAGVHIERRIGEGEGARSTHALNWNLKTYPYAAHVTKNSKTARYVAKKRLVNAMFVAHSSSVRHNRGFKNRCTNEWSDRTTFQKSASQKQTGQSWRSRHCSFLRTLGCNLTTEVCIRLGADPWV